MPIEQKRHSRLSITSFVLSLLTALLYFSSPALVFNIGVSWGIFIVLCLLAILMPLMAILLGVIGLLRRNRKKAFALVGVLISIISVLVFMIFISMLLKGFRVPGI